MYPSSTTQRQIQSKWAEVSPRRSHSFWDPWLPKGCCTRYLPHVSWPYWNNRILYSSAAQIRRTRCAHRRTPSTLTAPARTARRGEQRREGTAPSSQPHACPDNHSETTHEHAEADVFTGGVLVRLPALSLHVDAPSTAARRIVVCVRLSRPEESGALLGAGH